ncbi:hypothetical protein GECvBMG_gp227 [Salmonella phage GEC_vB_MG]|nr:hypothetical protein GECvBMG_gp227 [Salmonella phage GEC_vB_MG]
MTLASASPRGDLLKFTFLHRKSRELSRPFV